MLSEGGPPRALAKTHDHQQSLIGWSNDSRSIYVREYNGTADFIFVLPIDSSSPVGISKRGDVIDNVAVNYSGVNTGAFCSPERIALILGNPSEPPGRST